MLRSLPVPKQVTHKSKSLWHRLSVSQVSRAELHRLVSYPKVLAKKRATAALTQKVETAAKVETSAEMQASAKAALKSYVVGMRRQVRVARGAGKVGERDSMDS